MKSNSKIYLLYIILLSTLIYVYYNFDIKYYYTIKYLTTNRSIDIMISLLMSFVFIEYFISSYYYYILNKNHIIIRIGRNKYILYIIKKINLCFILVFLSKMTLFSTKIVCTSAVSDSP